MKFAKLLAVSIFVISQFASAQPFRITETLAHFPALDPLVVQPPVARLPSRSFMTFGRSYEGNRPVACNASPITNALNCFDMKSGVDVGNFPLPGRPTSTPFFYSQSWFFGTSEGFFIRVSARDTDNVPAVGAASIEFWGANARHLLHDLRPVLSEKKTSERKIDDNVQPQGWMWRHAGSAEFVGTPVVLKDTIFVLSSNQFLHAFEIASGRLLWATRLSADVPLRLASTALAATQREILVGTNDGNLLAINPVDGKELGRVNVPSKGDERFPAIFARPLVAGRSAIVSNASHQTIRVNLDSRVIEWTYPVGSVAEVREGNSNVYLAGADGAVHAIDKVTGQLQWKRNVTSESPVASVGTIRPDSPIFVASQNGSVFLLETSKGTIIDSQVRLGNVTGEFVAGASSESEVCLTFVATGVRCFVSQIL